MRAKVVLLGEALGAFTSQNVLIGSGCECSNDLGAALLQ